MGIVDRFYNLFKLNRPVEPVALDKSVNSVESVELVGSLETGGSDETNAMVKKSKMASLCLPDLPCSCSTDLKNAVTTFNQLTPKKEFSKFSKDEHIQRVILLDKISTLLEKEPLSFELSAWQADDTVQGWERQLQKYGVHRDASPLLKTYEFSRAALALSHRDPVETTKSYADCMKARAGILSKDVHQQEVIEGYLNLAGEQAHLYQQPAMADKIVKHKETLALSYAKIEAIRGLVSQTFDEYTTEKLGEGNNQNFFLRVEGMDQPLVIRVEDRHDLGHEVALRQHDVSSYFSEDYATVMLPFKEEEGATHYKPVVISQFAKDADLSSYAKKLKGQPEDTILDSATKCFGQLGDFFTKLMDSGHFHPDIKLTNFLMDNGKVLLSDRKTITNKIVPLVCEIASSPLYGAPEYQECINGAGTGFTYKAQTMRLNMPQYMSYQTGMALKEFLLFSMADKVKKAFSQDDFYEYLLSWAPISSAFEAPSDKTLNLTTLIQELTRPDIGTRLSIEHFQKLLPQIAMSPANFLAEVDKLSKPPSSVTLAKEEIQRLISSHFEPKVALVKLKKLREDIDLSDPRLQVVLQELISKSNVSERIKAYSASVESVLPSEIFMPDEETTHCLQLLQMVGIAASKPLSLSSDKIKVLGEAYEHIQKTTLQQNVQGIVSQDALGGEAYGPRTALASETAVEHRGAEVEQTVFFTSGTVVEEGRQAASKISESYAKIAKKVGNIECSSGSLSSATMLGSAQTTGDDVPLFMRYIQEEAVQAAAAAQKEGASQSKPNTSATDIASTIARGDKSKNKEVEEKSLQAEEEQSFSLGRK